MVIRNKQPSLGLRLHPNESFGLGYFLFDGFFSAFFTVAFSPTLFAGSFLDDFPSEGFLLEKAEVSHEATFLDTLVPAGVFDDLASNDLLLGGLEATFADLLATGFLVGSFCDFPIESLPFEGLEPTFEVAFLSALFTIGFFDGFVSGRLPLVGLTILATGTFDTDFEGFLFAGLETSFAGTFVATFLFVCTFWDFAFEGFFLGRFEIFF